MIRTSSNLGLRLGALVAATSLMVAGGAAVASASFAANNDNNGQGSASQTKPKPNANPNNPQKDDPNATTGANNDNGNFGPSGSNNDAFEPGKKVWVCHADTNNGNAANAADAANGGGNNLGQNGGGNTHKGFSIIYISWQGWLSNHDRLHENDRYFETEAGAQGYCGTPTTSDWYRCIAPGPVEQVTGVTSKPEGDGWVEGTAPVGTACPTPGDWYRCIVPGPVEQVTGVTSKPEGDGWLAGIAPAGTACPEGGARAAMQAELCEVNGKSLASPAKTWTGPEVKAANLDLAIAGATDALVAQLKDYAGKNPNAIVKPFGGFSANWTAEGQQIFAEGCVIPVGTTAAQALAGNPLPGTVASTPKPAQVQSPASATLPGSVNAGGGSSAPALPMWALAMMVIGALGAAASGATIFGSRK